MSITYFFFLLETHNEKKKHYMKKKKKLTKKRIKYSLLHFIVINDTFDAYTNT